ncbi:MAG: thioredoxin [Desulfobacterales bacterium]|jgi:thioredoxin 1
MADHLQEFTDDNFDTQVIGAGQPVLVDFWAPWCGPCKAIGPVVEALAADFEGRVKVGKCNADDNPKTPARFGVRSVPTVMVFMDGKVFDQMTGMVNRKKIEDALNRAIEGGDAASPFVVSG